MNDIILHGPGAEIGAGNFYQGGLATRFIKDERGEFWSMMHAVPGKPCPVQRHTPDGWVSAVFRPGQGKLTVVGPGEEFTLPDGRKLISRSRRMGVRWEYADPPL